MEEIERHRPRGFTLFEFVVVLSVLCLLIALLLPSMACSRDRSRFIKWAGYSHNLRIDPDLRVYLTFDNQEPQHLVHNMAVGDPFSGAADADTKPQPIAFPPLSHQHPLWTHTDARWEGKNGLRFHWNTNASAPSLDDSGAYLQIDDPVGLRETQWKAFTFFAWINQITTHNGCILSQGDPEHGGFELFVANNTIHCRAAGRTISARHEIGVNRAHLVAIAFGHDGRLSLWLDGNEQSGVELDRPFIQAGSPFYIGRRASISAGFLNAIVDEIALFDRRLKDDRMVELYRVGLARTKNHPVDWMQIIFAVMTTIDGILIGVHFVFKPMCRMMRTRNEPLDGLVIPERVDHCAFTWSFHCLSSSASSAP